MASARCTIGSLTFTPTSRAHIRAHAERLLYLGDASKIRAFLIREYGDPGRVPSLAYLQTVIDERKAPRTVLSRGQVKAS